MIECSLLVSHSISPFLKKKGKNTLNSIDKFHGPPLIANLIESTSSKLVPIKSKWDSKSNPESVRKQRKRDMRHYSTLFTSPHTTMSTPPITIIHDFNRATKLLWGTFFFRYDFPLTCTAKQNQLSHLISEKTCSEENQMAGLPEK